MKTLTTHCGSFWGNTKSSPATRTLNYEQNLTGRRLAIVALSAIQLPIIKNNLPQIIAAIDNAVPGSFRQSNADFQAKTTDFKLNGKQVFAFFCRLEPSFRNAHANSSLRILERLLVAWGDAGSGTAAIASGVRRDLNDEQRYVHDGFEVKRFGHDKGCGVGSAV